MIHRKTFLEQFLTVFIRIHSNILPSRFITRLGDCVIFEERFPHGRTVPFFFFIADGKSLKRWFPHSQEAFISFESNGGQDIHCVHSVISGYWERRLISFNCPFGYILHADTLIVHLEEEFGDVNPNLNDLEHILLQLVAHEIRHELQIVHGLWGLDEMRRQIPRLNSHQRKGYLRQSRSFVRELIGLQKELIYTDPEQYFHEMDAYITQFLVVQSWMESRSFSPNDRIRRLREIMLTC